MARILVDPPRASPGLSQDLQGVLAFLLKAHVRIGPI